MKISTKIILGAILILLLIIIIIATGKPKPKEQIVLIGVPPNETKVYEKSVESGNPEPVPLPNPPTPSNIEKITVQDDVIVVQRGASVIMKIGVYNPNDFIATNITPEIKCRENVISSNVTESKDIPIQRPAYFTYSMKINPLINPGAHICDIMLNARMDYISKNIVIQVN